MVISIVALIVSILAYLDQRSVDAASITASRQQYARLVSAWFVMPAGHRGGQIVVQNFGNAPITQVIVDFESQMWKGATHSDMVGFAVPVPERVPPRAVPVPARVRRVRPRAVRAVPVPPARVPVPGPMPGPWSPIELPMDAIPPCTTATEDISVPMGDLLRNGYTFFAYVKSVTFTDINGTSWIRSDTGALTSLPVNPGSARSFGASANPGSYVRLTSAHGCQ